MNTKAELLHKQDVVTIKNDKAKLFMPHVTFQNVEFAQHLITKLTPNNEDTAEWFKDGVEAEVLCIGKGWRKGKVRLTLEFYPDEPESPLDEFREFRKEN